jgi:LPXTG-site transpeptidase (sortase) family protein
MQVVIRDKLSTISTLVIILGALCLSSPFIWSVYSDYLQGQERQRWDDSQTDRTGARPVDDRFKITIPKMGLDAIVIEQMNDSDLDRGPVHLMATVLPGSPGNCCIAAHKEKWFRKLKYLLVGDEVILQIRGRHFSYRVTGQKIVRADDLSVLEDGHNSTVTLITCTGPAYFGRGNGRLIVTASLDKVWDDPQ